VQAVAAVAMRRRVGPPFAAVDDDVLADRVRSELGPLVGQLDLPHPHVMVEKGMVLLHGDVDTDRSAATIERAVLSVSGVRGIRSHLHVGLLPSDSRPSEGRAVHRPSAAYGRLLDAARDAGAEGDDAQVEAAVSAVLSALVTRLPVDERRQFLSHLPTDVRALAVPAQHHWHERLIRRRSEFLITVDQADAMAPGVLRSVVNNVIGTLRQLVPEEAADVAAVLPHDLRQLWRESVPV
jgi:uncharacterized protein (DUF2267 family)